MDVEGVPWITMSIADAKFVLRQQCQCSIYPLPQNLVIFLCRECGHVSGLVIEKRQQGEKC